MNQIQQQSKFIQKQQIYTQNLLGSNCSFQGDLHSMNQKISSKSKNKQFQLLDEDSPQIRASSPPPDQSIQNLELEGSVASKIKISSKGRRKKANGTQTNLIKIKPIRNDKSQTSVEKPSLNNFIQKQQSIEKVQSLEQVTKNAQQNIEKDYPELESPVLYRMSDEQQQISERKQQEIPQSSRRPLANSPTTEKKSDSDELESPIKLIRSPRKPRTKNKNFSRSKNVHSGNEKVQNLEERQPTQVYQYKGNDKQYSFSNSEKDETSNEEEQSENTISAVDDFRGQKVRKAPEVIVFKSNSFFTLVNAEIPKSNFVNCIIKRKRGEDFFQKFVTYELYLLEDKKYLMSCVKNRLFKTTSHFEFYREKASTNKFHKDNLYAYLDSNFTGTQFVLKTIQRDDTMSQRSTTVDKAYSHKFEDSMTTISDKVPNGTKIFPNQKNNPNQNEQNISVFEQKQVCFICFKANFFGLAGQREVKLLKKTNKKLGRSGNFSDLKTAQQNGEIDKFKELNSRKAILGKNGLELDFKGIAQIQSTKNIILENDSSEQVLIFGKVKDDIYLVSIGNPLSIIQGLAFGIANLDRKFFVN